MGLSSKKTKTTSNTSQTGTTTPVAEPWVRDTFTNYTDRINDLLDRDPGGFVAPASTLQQQAWDTAAQGPNLADATRASDYMDDYRNPFEQQVVDTTLAGFDDNAGRVRAAQAAQAAQAGAFGGSRYGIREAQTEADLARERAAQEAALRYQGFNTALTAGADDANRAQQTSQFNANQRDENTALQAQLGGQQWTLDQLEAMAPIAQLEAAGGLYGNVPWQAFVGQNVNSTGSGTSTTRQSGGLFQDLLGAGLGLFSMGGFK